MPRLRGLAVLFAAGLAGCWSNPPPPTSDAKAFASRADIATDESSPVYRFELTPEIEALRKRGSLSGLAVFDASGKMLRCGASGNSLNDPVWTLRNEIAATVAEADLSRCGSPLPTCISGKPCVVPDYCPHRTVDVAGTALEDAARIEDLVAAASTALSPPPCRPESGDADRECATGDDEAVASYHRNRQRKADARRILERAEIRYTPQPPAVGVSTAKGARHTTGSSRSMLDGALVMQTNAGDPQSDELRKPLVVDPPLTPEEDAAGWLIALDSGVPAHEWLSLELTWNLPPPIPSTEATLISFNTKGGISRDKFHVGPDNDKYRPGAAMIQTVPARDAGRYYRVVLPSTSAQLKLVSARAVYYTSKPFLDGRRDHWYWFEATTNPPYRLGLDPQQGGCGGYMDRAMAATLPRLGAPEWPPLARMGAVQATPMNWRDTAVHDQKLAAWLRWSEIVLGTWLAAMLVILARWAWLARSRGAH